MSHYDTLGVAADATPEEIKKAWRRRSSSAHPDREGGSVEAQQAVNKAYEVLCNPEARAHYDQTGQDGPQPSTPQQEAESMLVRFFSDALQQPGPVLPFVHRCLKGLEEEARAAISDIDGKILRLQRRRDAVKHPDPANHFHALVDEQQQQLARQRANAEVLLTITPLVRTLLEGYDSAEEPAERPLGRRSFFEDSAFAFDPAWNARPGRGL